MDLPEAIKNTAQALGKSLREDDLMRAYFAALGEFQANLEAVELEQRLYRLYEVLITRQQAGEELSREDTQEFFELRSRVYAHPLISKRDEELRLIKPYLAEIADEMSAVLGVDYTALAR